MKNDIFWTRIIYVVSIAISLVVAFLILGPRPQGIEGALDVSVLPLVNATINSITTILLLYGYYLIVNKKIDAHKNVMLTCFGTSTLFYRLNRLRNTSAPSPFLPNFRIEAEEAMQVHMQASSSNPKPQL